MKKWLRDAPIRQKLVTLGLVASGCALVVASLIFLVTTYVVSRRAIHGNIVAQWAITADNVSAALAFGDSAAAADTLHALRATAAVDNACLWNTQAQLFAAYERSSSLSCPGGAPADVDRMAADHIEIARGIAIGGRRVGTLYIRANLDELVTRVRIQAVASLAALVLGGLAALAIGMRFQRIISDPLMALASTASDVSRRGDYSVRAEIAGGDEIGQLVVTVNEMLHQVERRNQELRAANRLKDEFLATLSHELRTPLNAILGWLQILRLTPPSAARLDQALSSLERNARAQSRLVEDLLDVSRIVAGKLQLKVALIDLTHVVDEAIEVIRPTAEVKRIRIDRQFEPVAHLVSGDPDRLQQAVWNLLANAVKFSDPASRVTVSLTQTPHEVSLAIADQGAGISLEFLPYAFEPFRQADGSTTRKHGGLGLGLAIVREILQAHGGRVDAFSDGVGRGARFELHLPNVRNGQPGSAAIQADRGSLPTLKGVSALVVDDDTDAREVAAAALAHQGAYVTTAPDAARALHLIASRDIDVLVADLSMPQVDGYQLLAQIRERELTTGHSIPAIAVTALASAEEETRAAAAGFAEYVRKPYRFEDLVDAVEAVTLEVRKT